jgi:conjugal transfer mating pair stabilization protein TraG
MVIGAMMLYAAVITGNWLEIVRTWMAPVTLVVYVLFLPTMTVWVHDDASRYQQKLDNVPYGLGLFASYFSSAGKYITEQVEKNFSTPDDLSYQKTGMMFGSNILEKARTFRITNTNLRENMRNFVGQCVKYDIMLNGKYTFDDLKKSEDIWALVSTSPSKNRGIMWLPPKGGRAEYVTCAGAIVKFNDVWKEGNETENSLTDFALKLFSGRAIGHSSSPIRLKMGKQLQDDLKKEITQTIQSTYSYFSELELSVKDLMKQHMMINAVEDAAAHNSHLSGNALAFAEAKALFQQRTTYETLGRMASKVLPIMKAVMEALVYACFIFIVPLCMIPNGYKFLINWCGTLIWLQAWAPVYAVLNHIMNIAARASTLAEVGLAGGITAANMVGVSEANAEMSTLAGYLALSVPFICIAIVNGVGTFVHLAGQLTGTTAQAGSAAAAEIAGGNFSYGNVSVGNRQAGNVSQLQRNFSGSLQGADYALTSGTEQMRYGGDGSFVFHDQYSTGRYEGSYDDSIAAARGLAVQSQENLLRASQTELAEANAIKDSRGTDFAHQISNLDTNSESDSAVKSAIENKQFQSALGMLESRGKSDDYSQGSATKMSLNGEAHIGSGNSSSASKRSKKDVGVWDSLKNMAGSSLGMGGDTSADARNAHSFSESEQVRDDRSFREAEDIVKNFAKTVANSNASSELKSSASKYLQSVEKSESLTERVSEQKQRLYGMTNSYNESKSNSFGMRYKGVQDDVREELMKKGFSPEEAARAVRRGDPAAKEAFETVRDQSMHSVPKCTIAKNDFPPERDALKKKYFADQALTEKKMSETESGMKYEPNTDVQKKVFGKVQALNEKLETEKTKLDAEKKILAEKVDDRAKNNTLTTAGKQVWNSVTNWNPNSKK